MPQFKKGNPGKPKGAKNRFKKPRNINLKNKGKGREIKGRWKPGESGNPKGRPKGSGVKDIALAFNVLLARESDKDAKQKKIDELFYALFDQARGGAGQAAARTLLAWGIGMPKQMVQVTQGVDIEIKVAPELDNVDLKTADNVFVDDGKSNAD